MINVISISTCTLTTRQPSNIVLRINSLSVSLAMFGKLYNLILSGYAECKWTSGKEMGACVV